MKFHSTTSFDFTISPFLLILELFHCKHIKGSLLRESSITWSKGLLLLREEGRCYFFTSSVMFSLYTLIYNNRTTFIYYHCFYSLLLTFPNGFQNFQNFSDIINLSINGRTVYLSSICLHHHYLS